MNLKQNPDKEQLRALIASQDDRAGHHMICVSVDGDVFINVVPQGVTPGNYSVSLGEKLQFRLETLMVGNGWVGPQAAKDDAWVTRLYTALTDSFARGFRGYLDSF